MKNAIKKTQSSQVFLSQQRENVKVEHHGSCLINFQGSNLPCGVSLVGGQHATGIDAFKRIMRRDLISLS